MTILHLTTFLQGGAGRVLVDLATAQRRRGHQVAVVASQTEAPGYGHYRAFIAELTESGVPVWLVDSLFHREPAANLRAVALVNRLCRHAPPDVLHTHAAVPSLVALVAAGHARRAVRIVQTMHGWGLAKSPAQADCDVRVMNLVDRIVVPSTASAAELRAQGVDPALLTVIPYGVGPDREVLDRTEASLAAELARRRRAGAFVLCCVGTIGARKNQALLVEAIAQLPPARNVVALFVGDGEQDGLRAAIDRAGLGARALVAGYTPAARALARSADALVLPSRSEGQPLSILEAFADRTLVIASAIPSLAALVRDGQTGLLHWADDARALARAIARAMDLTPVARARIVARAETLHAEAFTAEAMAQHYMDAYQALGRTPVALRRAG